jgi:gliding motility-associated-like protein
VHKLFLRTFLFIFYLLNFSLGLLQAQICFTQNKGQWDNKVLYNAEVPAGNLYLESNCFTYSFYDNSALHEFHEGHIKTLPPTYKAHAFKVQFLGCTETKKLITSREENFTRNYFHGSDPSKWAGNVKSFQEVQYKNLYKNIDLTIYEDRNTIKYDFIVFPDGKVSEIALQYEGANTISIDKKGNLLISTSLNEVKECKPYAYQINDARIKKEIRCKFVLKNNVVTYSLPNGYDKSLPLIIDPQISFSTYIGSFADNFGYTASYDQEGNLYGGGIVFAVGYPTTIGAYDEEYNGGNIDCGITKFSADGTQLIYSLYLGGTANESPHSLVVNSNSELFIYGTTSSSDFPTTETAFQSVFAGGPPLIFTIPDGFNHENGSDVFISKFSADGAALLGSTYIGGSDNDGLNDTQLALNYGDFYRGEITLDNTENPCVASCTLSDDFPVTSGCFQASSGGGIDGVVFKLTSNLSELTWSSYFGGSNDDACYALQLDNDNNFYFTGPTASSNLPVSANAMNNDLGGIDGFVTKVNSSGTAILGCTYVGTSDLDESFFVQLDPDENVFVVGQTTGNYPISAGVYSNPNSGQFIHKISNDLSTSLLSTTVGTESGEIDISPSAFLVSNCGQVYLSGWGGVVNSFAGLFTSTTFGMPVTDDAFQSSTDGSDFYLMVLSPNMENLEYATFFGGGSSYEHVDGGTSRFDKNGTVYQAVCAGCGSNDDFPTQTGVWSQTNNSFNCNLGVFKFELSSVYAIANFEAPDLFCPGSVFDFDNNSIGANSYDWAFGDGDTSTEESPSHTYNDYGEYTVQLIASDTIGCLEPDTTLINFEIIFVPDLEIETVEPICNGVSTQLFATGGLNYSWSPTTGLSNSTIEDPTVSIDETTEYQLISFSVCGNDTAYVVVNVNAIITTLTEDTSICIGSALPLLATGGSFYAWSPDTYLTANNIPNPTSTPLENITYEVLITTAENCTATNQVTISVINGPPNIELTVNDSSICKGSSTQIIVLGAIDYEWTNVFGLNNYNTGSVIASPEVTSAYTVVGSNQCGTDEESITVSVHEAAVYATGDTITCTGGQVMLNAFGCVSYVWTPVGMFDDAQSSNPLAMVTDNTTFFVQGTDEYGCLDYASVSVQIFPPPTLTAGPDLVTDVGLPIGIQASSSESIVWEESEFLSCFDCEDPIATPEVTSIFYASIVDEYGCKAKDSMIVYVLGSLYIPNSFSPNGDGINDLFKAIGVDIQWFYLEIFNRWGEPIYTSDDIQKGWDGSINGYLVAPDVFVWRIKAKQKRGVPFEKQGTVTVVR